MASKLLLLGLLVNLLMLTDASIGVCNGRLGNNLPKEEETVTLYKNHGISRMRIYDSNHTTLDALGETNIELMIGVTNVELEKLKDQSEATIWVRDNILHYYPNVNFKYIAVGNEVDPDPQKESSRYKDALLPAMQNVYKALKDAGLEKQIKVSTATYDGLLKDTFPPSNGKYKEPGFIEPIIRFLVENKLPMLANVYPYFGYLGTDVPHRNLSYALFTVQGTVVPDQNLQYSNLFDAMLDSHYAALNRVGGGSLDIVVSESGWPSAGGLEGVTTLENAGTYYKNLIEHVTGTLPKGTPLKPGKDIETYLFAMFDENEKSQSHNGEAATENHFGIFNPMSRNLKYDHLSFN